MLAGVNIGGLGIPIASLASMVTIQFYMRRSDAKVMRFFGIITAANVLILAFLLFFAQIF